MCWFGNGFGVRRLVCFLWDEQEGGDGNIYAAFTTRCVCNPARPTTTGHVMHRGWLLCTPLNSLHHILKGMPNVTVPR